MKVFQNISAYETQRFIYVVGQVSPGHDVWRLLKFERGNELQVTESVDLSSASLQKMLADLHQGNLPHGGLRPVGPKEADCLIGCFKWTTCYYLLLVTRKRLVGTIHGCNIYGIDAIALLPLSAPPPPHTKSKTQAAEQRYRHLLSLVTLTTDFFFSYTWPLWQSVQQTLSSSNRLSVDKSPTTPTSIFENDRVWNHHISAALRESLGHDNWITPLIHGYWRQEVLSLLGTPLTLTLIARRSKFNAGTRYLKRGVNDSGHVANDVETEQVIEAGIHRRTKQPLISSVVQVRGSVPVYWSQHLSEVHKDGLPLRPSIRILQHLDPLRTATARHFTDLRARFGDPITCLNLIKQSSKKEESVLGREYQAAISFLNRTRVLEPSIQYLAYDLSHAAKSQEGSILTDLQRVLSPVLEKQGVFNSFSTSTTAGCTRSKTQKGVLRTNCVDCLDRTNIAQFVFGLLALGKQLYSLGISESSVLDADSSMAGQLTRLYEDMGHKLSLQYGGSEAHTGFFFQKGDWLVGGRDMLRSFIRLYSNVVSDDERQQAINLFLGLFVPTNGHNPDIWTLSESSSLAGSSGGLPRTVSSPRELDSSEHRHVNAPSNINTDDNRDDGSESSSDDEEEEGDAPTPALSEVIASTAHDFLGTTTSKDTDDSNNVDTCEDDYLDDAFGSLRAAILDGARRAVATSGVASSTATPAALFPLDHRQSIGQEVVVAAPASSGLPRLESLDQLLPRQVSQVRLAAFEKGDKKGKVSAKAPGVGWTSPIKDKRPLRPPPPAPLPAARRPLPRSNSEGTLTRTVDLGSYPSSQFPLPGNVLQRDNVLPSSTGIYHRLASLNLDALENSPAMRAPSALGHHHSSSERAISSHQFDSSSSNNKHASQQSQRRPLLRRLSHASLAALRQFTGRGGSLTPHVAPSVENDLSLLPTAPSTQTMLGGSFYRNSEGYPSLTLNSGGMAPLDMTAVIYQRDAFQRGIDRLGIAPAVASLWLSGANPVYEMERQGAVEREQQRMRLERMSVPLTLAEMKVLGEEMIPEIKALPVVY